MDTATVAKLTQQYLQGVINKWGNLDSFQLESAFVLLQALEKSRLRNAELATTSQRLANAGIEIAQKESDNESATLVSISQALNKAKHLVLLGEPGSGKSTMMAFLGLCFAGAPWTRKHIAIEDKKQNIPILLPLQSYPSIIGYRELRDAALRKIEDFSGEDTKTASDLYDEWAEQNNPYQLVFLFDGLDEAENIKSKVKDEIENFANTVIGKRARIIVSSRITGFSKFPENFKEITLKPLHNDDEIIPYLTRWLHTLTEWSNEQVQTEAELLLKRLHQQPALNRILDNPLILKMIAEVYGESKAIPSNRADIYKNYFYRIAKRRGLDFKTNRVHKQKIQSALQSVAWHMHINGERNRESLTDAIEKLGNIKPEDAQGLFEEIYTKLNLIVVVDGKFRFAHQTIQEYFVAERLKEAWKKDTKMTWTFIRPRLHLATWREPLSLLVASLDEEDRTVFITKLRKAKSRYENKLHRDYFLAAKLIGESGSDIHKLRRPYFLQTFYPNSLKRSLAIRACGFIGGEIAVDLILRAYFSENKMIRDSVSDAVVQLDEKSLFTFLESLKKYDSAWALSTNMLWRLASIGGQESIYALTEVIKENPDKLTRWHAVWALGKIKEPSSIPIIVQGLEGLMDDRDEDVGLLSSRTLEEFSEEAIPYFIDVLDNYKGNRQTLQDEEYKFDHNPSIRSLVAKALGKIDNPNAISLLFDLMQNDNDIWVRISAVKTLGQNKDRRFTNLIVNELCKELDKDKWGFPPEDQVSLRWAFAHAIEDISNHLDPLILFQQAQQYGDGRIREIAYRALDKVGSTGITPDIVKVLSEEYYRWGMLPTEGIRALGRTQELEAISLLTTVMENSLASYTGDYYPEGIISALGEIGNPKFIPALKTLISTKAFRTRVRIEAIEALGKIKDTLAKKSLIEILEGESENLEGADIRAYAIDALSNFKDTETIDVLTPYLFDEEKELQDAGAVALSKMGIQAIPNLAKALHANLQWTTQEIVVKALGSFKNLQSTEILIEALTNINAFIRVYAAQALGDICKSQADKDIIETIKTKAVPILIDLLESPKGDKDKHYFMMEFGKIDALKAVEFLARAPLEPYSLTYWSDALDTIGMIGDISVIDVYLIEIIKKTNDEEGNASYSIEKAIINILRRWKLLPDYEKHSEDKDRFPRIVKKLEKNPNTEILALISEIQDNFMAPSFDPLHPPPRPLWHWVLLAGLVFALIGILNVIVDNSQNLLLTALIGILVGFAGWILDTLRERTKSKT